MVFSFHHLKVDFMGNDKWVLVPTDFGKLKDILFSWQEGMAAHNAWNAVFWCNHDQPRVVSRFGDEGEYWKESAKMLANIVHAMRGTPYVYQGEELGMTNANFTSLDQYRDVESLNHFQILRDKGMSEESVYNILKVHSRDNSRTPMQWDATAQGGFTTGEPWISVNPNTATINAQAQVEDVQRVRSGGLHPPHPRSPRRAGLSAQVSGPGTHLCQQLLPQRVRVEGSCGAGWIPGAAVQLLGQ